MGSIGCEPALGIKGAVQSRQKVVDDPDEVTDFVIDTGIRKPLV